jgi:exodeoxyribonuclease V alpha subunit
LLNASGRLYLRRYWEYEKALARGILIRCQDQTPINPGTGDLQELAIETALARRFVVISGGLGTGKTTTVLRILRHDESDFLMYRIGSDGRGSYMIRQRLLARL